MKNTTKQCPTCEQEKLISEFYPNKHGGKKTDCKSCFRQKMAGYKSDSKQFHNIIKRDKDAGKDGSPAKDLREWFDKQRKMCHYCSIELWDDVPNGSLRQATIDTFDPTKGHIIGNITLSCRRCNIIKGNWFTPKEMRDIACVYRLGERK